MIFTARQLNEKCREQQKNLYGYSLTWQKHLTPSAATACKHFWENLVVRTSSWTSSNLSMMAWLLEWLMAGLSEPFTVRNGTKQGCVLASLLFNIFYAAMLLDAFHNNDLGINVHYRTDGRIFNLPWLNAKSKISELLVRDLLYADDCALVAHSLEDAQMITDCFAPAAKRFDLTISIKKTEVLKQEYSGTSPETGNINIGDIPLQFVDKFCYLGSRILSNGSLDGEITHRIERRVSVWSAKVSTLE